MLPLKIKTSEHVPSACSSTSPQATNNIPLAGLFEAEHESDALHVRYPPLPNNDTNKNEQTKSASTSPAKGPSRFINWRETVCRTHTASFVQPPIADVDYAGTTPLISPSAPGTHKHSHAESTVSHRAPLFTSAAPTELDEEFRLSGTQPSKINPSPLHGGRPY